MPSAGEPLQPARPSVFLSYASEDREQVTVLRDALAATGLEVWFDANELGGGDAWDQKIRRQIKECDYFMPVISASTEARHEGYFRREWRLAVERSLDMADDHAFLLPVVIDATQQEGARVPEKFLGVQWLRLPGGRSTPALGDLCQRLLTGRAVNIRPSSKPPIVRSRAEERREANPMPAFPMREKGREVRFALLVLVWLLRSIKPALMRLPRWVRYVMYIWLFMLLLSRGCSHHGSETTARPLPPEAEKKLHDIGVQYGKDGSAKDLIKLGAEIAKDFAKDEDGAASSGAYLAIPFSAAKASPDESKLADTAFAQTYGRLSISKHGHVQLGQSPVAALDTATLCDAGRAGKAQYVVGGAVVDGKDGRVLMIEVVNVAERSLVWSKGYPVAGADPALISAEIESKIPAEDED